MHFRSVFACFAASPPTVEVAHRLLKSAGSPRLLGPPVAWYTPNGYLMHSATALAHLDCSARR